MYLVLLLMSNSGKTSLASDFLPCCVQVTFAGFYISKWYWSSVFGRITSVPESF